ncbi:hypothetical protein BH20CHL1_BH20CHL1_01210 [soil metagenome]
MHVGRYAIGARDEFILDTTGNLTSFVVNMGNTFGHEMRVVLEWIQNATRERIQLCITAAEAQISTLAGERAGKRSRSVPARRAHTGDTPA